MYVHPQWRKILRHSWNVRLVVICALMQAAEAVLPLFGILIPLPPLVMLLITLVVTVAAFVARLVPQKELRGEE